MPLPGDSAESWLGCRILHIKQEEPTERQGSEKKEKGLNRWQLSFASGLPKTSEETRLVAK